MINKTSIQVDNHEGINYQCTALDANSCIEVKISVSPLIILVQDK